MTSNYAGSREYGLEIRMNKDEWEALQKVGEKELRHPADVAFLLLRKALIDSGALKVHEKKTGRD